MVGDLCFGRKLNRFLISLCKTDGHNILKIFLKSIFKLLIKFKNLHIFAFQFVFFFFKI